MNDIPKVAVDLVIFSVRNGALKAILIQMKKKPFAGRWAFPGGRVSVRESLDDAARRELYEKTGLRNVYLEQLYTFGAPQRDPFSRVISVAYFALIPSENIRLTTTKKYSAIDWFDVGKLPPLAYDHATVARIALERLRAKLGYTNIAWSLLSKSFTLGELQRVYESILGKKLDKRNFWKRIAALDILKKSGTRRGLAQRPAMLYTFRSRAPRVVEILPQ